MGWYEGMVYHGDTQYTAWLHSTYMHWWSFFALFGSGFWHVERVLCCVFFFFVSILSSSMAERSTTGLLSSPMYHVCIPWVVSSFGEMGHSRALRRRYLRLS